jgi:AsmA protein
VQTLGKSAEGLANRKDGTHFTELNGDKLSGVTVPVRITGSFDALKYQVDYGAVVDELAKSKIADEIQKRVGGHGDKVEEQLRDRLLKGLIGR